MDDSAGAGGRTRGGVELSGNGRLRRQMAQDCARGMSYLHSRSPPVVHHDLKPANLLVDSHWTLKVSDFGMSRQGGLTFHWSTFSAKLEHLGGTTGVLTLVAPLSAP